MTPDPIEQIAAELERFSSQLATVYWALKPEFSSHRKTVRLMRDELQRSAAALRQQREAGQPQWRDIASAPKDGTNITLGWTSGLVLEYTGSYEPTHWMPLPQPPIVEPLRAEAQPVEMEKAE
jgi:hypothetical protein